MCHPLLRGDTGVCYFWEKSKIKKTGNGLPRKAGMAGKKEPEFEVLFFPVNIHVIPAFLSRKRRDMYERTQYI